MAYGQIITLMIALVLVSGAPANHLVSLSVPEAIFLWTLKTIVWWMAVNLFLRRSPALRLQIVSEKLQAAAIIPLVIDFYLLDIKDFMALIPLFRHIQILEEFVGLALYFLYLALVWSATSNVTAQKAGEKISVREEVSERLNMILPALIPYIILSAGIELASRFAPHWIRSLFSSSYSPLVSLALFATVLAFIVPPLLRKVWRCFPMPDTPLKHELLQFIKKTGVNFDEIYVWPLGGGRACTAAVVGIVPGFRYLLITPCLLKYLRPAEIEAVISHEAEHVKRRHIIWYVFFLTVYSAVMYRLMEPAWSWLTSRESFISLLLALQDAPEPLIALAAALPMMALIILYFRFFMGWFMRNFERQADMSVFRTQGHPWHMIAALEKVALFSGGTRDKPNWHHYSIAERVEFLSHAAENPALVQAQETKLFRAKTGFIAAASVLLIIPSVLPVKAWKKSANINLARLYIEQISSHGEQGAKWYLMLGQVLAEKHQYEKAEQAYLKALEIEPDNPLALNNLAWLYATAKDRAFQKPAAALMLAIRAASLKPDSYILDTLAECFFVNGYVKKAIETEKEALKKAKSNREYYLRQIQKFSRRIDKSAAI